MEIYPAIDLIDGKCVRLHKGDYDQQKTYSDDPFATAKSFIDAGAKKLHLVDLSGAKDRTQAQTDLIMKMAEELPLKIQTGGGIRSFDKVRALLSAGVDCVVIGSLAVKQPNTVKDWFEGVGETDCFTLAMDIRHNQSGDPMVLTNGWQKESDVILWDLVEDYAKAGAKYFLCTDIEQDGTLQGPNFKLYDECLKRFPELKWLASGGISSIEDVQGLKKQQMYGAIIGTALYEEKFTLEEALAC